MLHAVKAGARGRHEASLPASMFIFPTVLNAERFADFLVFLQVSSPSRAFGRQVSVAFGSVARLFASQQLKPKPLPTEVEKSLHATKLRLSSPLTVLYPPTSVGLFLLLVR